MSVLLTERLELVPLTLPVVEAVMESDRNKIENLVNAPLPRRWHGRALIERAFPASLCDIRKDPETRLWGDRLMIVRKKERRIVGSVIFHGRPGPDGIAEVGYGVEDEWQGQGFATEAVECSLEWALSQPGVRAVQATTFQWHRASLRVIEKCKMVRIGSREHEMLGELTIFERRAKELL
ncbi:GNAT family N-acetyltransferase [Pendulispora brunnea]|uniref:GNAT family N-acetyltransferase n=1 Tax=Pendulispora brunnea TaxID=2905690 RepID=A0ABZ2KRN4_9BACT